VDVHAVAVPRTLPRRRSVRIASPWAVAAIVALFYALLMTPGLVRNPYDYINIGRQYHSKGTSSPAINHARAIDDKIGYDGQFYYFLAVDPKHGRDYMDAPGVIYSRIGYPMTVRALSGGNASVIPYMMALVNILAAVGGTLAIALFLRRRGLPPALALLYGFFPGLALSVLRDLTEPLAFGLAAVGLVVFDARSKRRLLASALLFGLAMLTRETVALFPAILALGLLVGAGSTASRWRERVRLGNLVRAVAFAELAFAPLFIWRHLLATVVLPHATTQEAFASGEHHVVGGTAGAALAALVPFHAIAGQWPWTGADVTTILTVVLPALLWAGIAIALLRRKLSLEPFLVLANVAVFVIFVPTPIAIDYGSLGRASIGVLLAVLVTLPLLGAAFGERARLVRSSLALWSLPVYLVLAILLNALGPKFVW
jgi:hypothetical protein